MGVLVVAVVVVMAIVGIGASGTPELGELTLLEPSQPLKSRRKIRPISQ